jgi:hypothetical protein
MSVNEKVADYLGEALPIGTPVTYWLGFREGDGIKSVTRSNVWDVCGTPVVMVRGAAGGIALTHIERRELDDTDREPDCLAGWVEGNRRLFIDFPDEGAPVASQTRIAEVLLGHQMEWVEGAKTFDCSCNEDGSLDWMGTITEAVQHQLDAMLAAGVFRDEATAKAEAIREAAQAQRQLAADARTNNGQAEHEDFADWLDDRAFAIDPAVVEGAHP